jgi:hypothetical protein
MLVFYACGFSGLNVQGKQTRAAPADIEDCCPIVSEQI